jgi:hypothetical protein
MAWGDSPSDAGQLRGMKDAGLNISGFCRAEDLGRVKAAGLTCFVNDPKLTNYPLDQLPPVAILRRDIAVLKEQISDNSAALGFFLRDEPSASLMPSFGRLATLLREEMPDKWPYVNLFPLPCVSGHARHERLRLLRSHAGKNHSTAVLELRQLLARER